MTPPAKKPKLFIGSSREAIPYARAVHANLKRAIQALPWYDGTFRGNEYTLETLERRLDECDFAVFLFAADDVALIRGKTVFITRDNTVFEAGLFFGQLRRKRVFCLVPQEIERSDGEHIKGVAIDRLHLMTDLAGLTLLEYEYAHDNEHQAAVSVACGSILEAIDGESEPFFVHQAEKARRNGSIVRLFWEYSRLVPITEDAPLAKRYHALAEAIRLSFSPPPGGQCSVSHVALYAKRGNDGMAYVAGNMDEGAFYPFQDTQPDEEQPIVIKVHFDGEWMFTHVRHVEKISILCYPLSNQHVVSIYLRGESVHSKLALQRVVDLNVELLTTIKHLVGGIRS